MRFDQLAQMRSAQPFEPFRIYLSNGKSFDVRHPELLVVGRHTSSLGVASEAEGYILADHLVKIANDQIVTTAPLTVADQIDKGDQR